MGERIPFDETPKYLGATLDRTLSYQKHLLNTAAKVSKGCNLPKRYTSNHWGADITTLCTSRLPLWISVTEYCCPIWSQRHHCKKVSISLNECLRLGSGCIKSTITELLLILLGIEPVESDEIKTYKVSVYMRSKTLTFFTRLQYLHLEMLELLAECHYQLVCTVKAMTLMTYLLNTGPSMIGEDDGKILTTSSISSLHNRLHSGHGWYCKLHG